MHNWSFTGHHEAISDSRLFWSSKSQVIELYPVGPGWLIARLPLVSLLAGKCCETWRALFGLAERTDLFFLFQRQSSTPVLLQLQYCSIIDTRILLRYTDVDLKSLRCVRLPYGREALRPQGHCVVLRPIAAGVREAWKCQQAAKAAPKQSNRA